MEPKLIIILERISYIYLMDYKKNRVKSKEKLSFGNQQVITFPSERPGAFYPNQTDMNSHELSEHQIEEDLAFSLQSKSKSGHKKKLSKIERNYESSDSAEMTYEQFKEYKRTGLKKGRRPRSIPREEEKSVLPSQSSKSRHDDTPKSQNLKNRINQQIIKATQKSKWNAYDAPMLPPAKQSTSILVNNSNSPSKLKKTFSAANIENRVSYQIEPSQPSSFHDESNRNLMPIHIEDPPLVKKDKTIQYQSRGDIQYDDENSQDESDDVKSQVSMKAPRTNINYLRSQAQYYKDQLSKNQQLIEIEQRKAQLGANADQEVKPNKRFKNFNDIFSGLTKSKNVVTLYPIVECIITYDSRSAVTVTKKSDREYYVKQYSLESYKLTFEEKIGGKEDSYIKLKEVEQSSSGQLFAIVYMDDGKFRIRTFGQVTRTEEEIEKEEFDINAALGLNDFTMPIQNFPDPFITCTFTNDDIIFINLFHNSTLTHHHFFYNRVSRQITRHTTRKLDTNKKNFPYKCFYNSDDNEVYSFYRQCESFRVPVLDIKHHRNEGKEDYIFEKIFDRDLGQMYLINNTALVARCSSQILFFKLFTDEFTREKNWQNYQTLDIRGFIYFIKGNKRIQVTTDTKIYFYLIDPKTFVANLENVMFNFMNCSRMMFGSRVRYCVTFKTNQKSFDIHRRKYEHDYRVNIVSENLDGSRGTQIESMNAFLVSNINIIKFYDVDSYQEIKESQIKIPLLESVTREPNEIISMIVSHNEDYIAVISGKNLIMNEQKPNQLFIFRRIRNQNTDEQDQFTLQKRIVIKDLPEFNKICMQFCFKLTKNNKDPNTLIFAKQQKIMEFNFDTEALTDLYIYEVPLSRQPEFFLMNDDQTVSIVASMDDGIYYNFRNKKYIDLDELYQISNIKEVIHDHEDRNFYMLANKYQEKLGIFLIRFSEPDPANHNFILKWKNKLDISDADVNIVRNQKKKYKELVISYKTIFINTYNIIVFDISNEKEQKTLFRHECFQLWESQITGFYLNKNKDIVTINRDGINVVTINSIDKRCIMADNGQEKMCHSLQSTNYLKIDLSNFILFEFATDNNVVSIMQQYTKTSKAGDETNFENIYKIKIHTITLRELLLFQSLYVCNTQSDILRLVMDQPKPQVFYKSFLELDGSNMVSILSFDSRSMKQLLHDRNKEYFQDDYPIFYKNKIQKSNNKEKFFYRSAIDSALRNNQIRAVCYIIDYIVKYQNNYVSSFLFQKNIPHLIEKGIEVTGLFNSQIFCFYFDFDEWPSTHTDDRTYMRPFNETIFDLRRSYSTVFHEPRFQVKEDEEELVDSSKVYKVSYQINMLPMIERYCIRLRNGGIRHENEGVSLMKICGECEELDIFDSENFQQLIQFKWQTFAKNLHLRGCFMHFMYVTILIMYVDRVYILNQEEEKQTYSLLLILAIIYPSWYDTLQLYKIGWREYFSDIGNYSDLIYTWGSVVNVVLQNTMDPHNLLNKILMTLLLLQQVIKTFFFLRIFDTLSYIVTMINKVIYDLRVFLLFYGILIVLFSMIFAVLGVGNPNVPGDFQDFYNSQPAGEYSDEIPNQEYEKIGLFFGYIFQTLRNSLGDFDFEASKMLTRGENYVFWFIWCLVVIMTCIVFLNFIIAEASESYSSVKSRLQAMINKEKASLIAEAEDMTFEYLKDEKMFPKFIIIRQIET